MPERWTIPGSLRSQPPGEKIGEVDPNEKIGATILVRSKSTEPPPPGRLSREEFAARYGADQRDLDRVADFARAHGLEVLERSAARRAVVVSGTVRSMRNAFGVSLAMYRSGNATCRGRVGEISVPSEVQGVVEAVLGLDNRPQAKPRLRIAPKAATSFTPPQIAAIYDFPAEADGGGETIGIIELGGGYSSADFSTYCAQLGITAPSVAIVSVDGGTNAPGQDPNADTEVMLDVEVSGTIAHGARIVLYFAPNTDQGFIDAVSTAVHDRTNKPSVISISWGDAESNWTQSAMTALDQACAAGVAMGISICVASGDGGSSDGVNDGKPHADFPASSPNVLGCGGTTLSASNSTIASEIAWSDSGGGVSSVFPLPTWQSNAHVPAPSGGTGGRGVPDVCADADPNSGYTILADGQSIVVGGTSAVAPLWAGLIALLNQQLGAPVGLINPKLYTLPGYPSNPGPLRDITSGSNGAYNAGRGWDPVTGLGSPDGTRLETALSST
jgi:kumamolisin